LSQVSGGNSMLVLFADSFDIVASMRARGVRLRMKAGPGDKKVDLLIAGEELDQLKRFTVFMCEAYGLDNKIEKYAGKRPMSFYQWDMDCLLSVMELALRDDREYPDKSSSACMALGRLRDRVLDEYGRAYGHPAS
jgi:hypothetical protein